MIRELGHLRRFLHLAALIELTAILWDAATNQRPF